MVDLKKTFEVIGGNVSIEKISKFDLPKKIYDHTNTYMVYIFSLNIDIKEQ